MPSIVMALGSVQTEEAPTVSLERFVSSSEQDTNKLFLKQ
jgi:hypothetical protein